jgi:hypothetical protein
MTPSPGVVSPSDARASSRMWSSRAAMFSSVATVKSHARYRFERRMPAPRNVLKIDSKRDRWALIGDSLDGSWSR